MASAEGLRVSDLGALAQAVEHSLVSCALGQFVWDDARDKIPISSSIVQSWLESAQPRLPGFGLVRDGDVADSSEICRKAEVRRTTVGGLPSVERLEGKLRDGYSLVLSSMEAWSPDFASFLADFEQAFQAEALATCILSPPGARAFPLHDDPEDVIVIQLEGSKLWNICLDGRRVELQLNPNDVLYLPPSVPHEVLGGLLGSLHVTFGLRTEPLPAAVGRYFRTLILENIPNPRMWSQDEYMAAIQKIGEAAKADSPQDASFTRRPAARPRRRFTESLSQIMSLH
jgi:hypothetical protein